MSLCVDNITALTFRVWLHHPIVCSFFCRKLLPSCSYPAPSLHLRLTSKVIQFSPNKSVLLKKTHFLLLWFLDYDSQNLFWPKSPHFIKSLPQKNYVFICTQNYIFRFPYEHQYLSVGVLIPHNNSMTFKVVFIFLFFFLNDHLLAFIRPSI